MQIPIILFIIVINVTIYWNTLLFDIVIDDIARKKKKYPLKFTVTGLMEKFYGAGTFDNLKLDHALSLFLHTLTSVIIYLTFGQNIISFIGSIIYSIHPVNNQTAIWLNGRRYILNVILVLGIWAFRPFGIILYPITPLLQISSALAPLLYLFTNYWILVIILMIFPFVENKYIIQKFMARYTDKLKKSELTAISPKKMILVVKTFGYYFFHIIYPITISFYPDFYQEYGITKTGNRDTFRINKDFWLGISAISLFIMGYVVMPEIRLYLFWFLIFIAPFLNFITVTQLVADRYTSVAIVGLIMAMSTILVKYPIILAIMVGIYLIKNIKSQEMYRSIDDFYLYHLYNIPKAILPIIYYSKACIKGQMYYHAYVALRRGLIYSPNDMRLFLMLAKTLILIGHKGAAMIAIQSAEARLDDNIWMDRKELINDINKVREGLK